MKCEICGKEIEKSRYSHKVICSDKCFDEDFWLDKIKDKDEYIRIDGVCYHLGNEKDMFRGFGGSQFKIKFFDGREITSTNLWHNGDIPEKYKGELCDNAEFIRDGSSLHTND